MHSIEKKEQQEPYDTGSVTARIPCFREGRSHHLGEKRAEHIALDTRGVRSGVRQLLEQVTSNEAEVIAVALRHAKLSSTLLDRVRGRYRQLLLPLQAEAHRALQFLALQALTQSSWSISTQETAEAAIHELYGISVDTLREQLVDYVAHADTPGEVFASNVWTVIHGPREGERFAVFALRMNSLFRRLASSFSLYLEDRVLDPNKRGFRLYPKVE